MSKIEGKTAVGLIAYASAQLGRPYWYGTFGQTASEALFAAKKKQYPGYYTDSDFKSQYGQRVHDCAGLIKGYLMSKGPDGAPVYQGALDKSAEGLYTAAAEKGSVGTMPDEPGVLVHMRDHVGVYIGGGYVIEARGHRYGVVKTRLSERPWTRWSRCPFIEYEAKPLFRDIEGHWAREAIERCAKAGLVNGRAADIFEPDKPVSRAELCAVLARLLDRTEV